MAENWKLTLDTPVWQILPQQFRNIWLDWSWLTHSSVNYEFMLLPVFKFKNTFVVTTELASHRGDRIFRSKQIWMQGLPTDPDQAMDIIKHIGDELKLSISSESIFSVGELFSALNKRPTQGSSPPMIGSTANSHATVVNLDAMATFSAAPKTGHLSTVTEFVIHTTSVDQQESYTTIVIVPWLLATTSELTLILRFHHIGMDAKSELVHAIYHQLTLLSDKHGHPVRQLKFIARIVTADKPLWVIDLIGTFGFSTVHLNHHFTGNSAGSLETIELDGIPTQVLGGYGISNAPLPGYSHPPLSWANLPTVQDLTLRFLAEILHRINKGHCLSPLC
jgi:hypothetical protein